jgi:hypothetical protein
MAFANMIFELCGELNVPSPLAQSRINEALQAIYDDYRWSFQLLEDGFFTPGLQFSSGLQSIGTITTVLGSTSIVGDATAAAQWVAYVGPPLFTQFQIRNPNGSLYNIVAFDGVNTITIDRPWRDSAAAGQAYMIYQAYFTAPVADFKRFYEIADTQNNWCLDYWSKTRLDLSIEDPQRIIFNLPSYVVPYERDNRPNTATPGYMMFELWPHPLTQLPYAFMYERSGPLLVKPGDTLSAPLTEEMVKWKARETIYLFKEGQKGDGVARGAGADWKFLAGAASAEYKKHAHRVQEKDKAMVDLYFTQFRRWPTSYSQGEPFSTVNSTLNVGRF